MAGRGREGEERFTCRDSDRCMRIVCNPCEDFLVEIDELLEQGGFEGGPAGLEPCTKGRQRVVHEGSDKSDVYGAFAQWRPRVATQLYKAEEGGGAGEVGIEVRAPGNASRGEWEAKVFVGALEGEWLVLKREEGGIDGVGNQGAFLDVELHVVVIGPGGCNVQLALEVQRVGVLEFDVIREQESTGEGCGGISDSGQKMGKGVNEEGKQERGKDGALEEATEEGEGGRAGTIHNNTRGEVVSEQGGDEGESIGWGLTLVEEGDESVVRDGVVGGSQVQEDMEEVGVDEGGLVRRQCKVEGGLVTLKSPLVRVDGSPGLILPLGNEVELKVSPQDLGQRDGAAIVDVVGGGGFGEKGDA